MVITIAWIVGIFLVAYLVTRTVTYFRRDASENVSPHPEPPEEMLRPGHRHR